jgi:hypothetical protein
MRCQGRLLLTSLATVFVLALGVATASAVRLSVTNQSISITWSTFRFNEGRAQCPVTLEGSLHARTITKTSGLLIGYIVRGRTSACSVGSAVLLTPEDGQTSSLPWHIRYDSFAGTLPAITRIRWHIFGFSYRIVKELETCLYTSTPTRPALLDLTREGGGSGALTTGSFFGTEAIPLAAGNIAVCEQSGLLGGSGAVTLQGSSTRVTISLI